MRGLGDLGHLHPILATLASEGVAREQRHTKLALLGGGVIGENDGIRRSHVLVRVQRRVGDDDLGADLAGHLKLARLLELARANGAVLQLAFADVNALHDLSRGNVRVSERPKLSM